MKKTYMTIRFETPLTEKVMQLAKAEKRSIADQAVYLMEKGLEVLEREQAVKTKRADPVSDQTYSLPGLE